MDIIKRFAYHKGETKDFLKSISYGGEFYNLFKNNFLFRGHSMSSYELKPSALRDKKLIRTEELKTEDSTRNIGELINIFLEYKLLQDFYKSCDDIGLYLPFISEKNKEFLLNQDLINSTFPDFDFWPPEDYYELAALAQHYGVPTRLLDWSRDINVAIYFALSDYLAGHVIEDDEYMTIWAMDGGALDIRNNSFPLKIIKPRYHFNSFLHAQKGVFSVWLTQRKEILKEKNLQESYVLALDRRVNDKSLDELIQSFIENNRDIFSGKTYMYRIDFYDIKQQLPVLYEYLEKTRATALYLFPGYKGVSKSILEKELVNKLINN